MKTDTINYLCYPKTPLELSKGPSAIELINFFNNKIAKKHHVLFTEMTSNDLDVMLKLPQDYGKKYFDMLCQKDETLFTKKKMAELNPHDQKNFSVVENLWEVVKNKVTVNLDLFEQKFDAPTQPVEVYFNLFKVNMTPGSDESIEFLDQLLTAEREVDRESLNQDLIASDIFLSKFVQSILEYKFKQSAWVSYFLTCLHISYLCTIFVTRHSWAIILFFTLNVIQESI